MFKRLPVAVLAALIFAASGSVAILATASPAIADQNDHANRSHHAHRAPNPHRGNGYWANGTWHNTAWHGNRPVHPVHPNHPMHPQHPAHHTDRDHR
jgi:hypothetical protein